MKKFIFIACMLVTFLFVFNSCSVAIDYYKQNKELIQKIIQSVIDSILTQVEKKLVSLSTKTDMTYGAMAISPNVDKTQLSKIYLQAVSEVVHDETFWNGVDQKVITVIQANEGK